MKQTNKQKLNIQKTKIMASCPITSWQIDGKTMETVRDFILGAPKSLQMVTAAMKLKDTYSLEGKFKAYQVYGRNTINKPMEQSLGT